MCVCVCVCVGVGVGVVCLLIVFLIVLRIRSLHSKNLFLSLQNSLGLNKLPIPSKRPNKRKGKEGFLG